MSNRRLFAGIVGVALLVIGLMALWFPVYLGQYDQFGVQITCGRGFSSNLSQAAEADGENLVAQCGTALLARRFWAIPAAAAGWLLLTGYLVAWVHNGPTAARPGLIAGIPRHLQYQRRPWCDEHPASTATVAPTGRIMFCRSRGGSGPRASGHRCGRPDLVRTDLLHRRRRRR